MWSEVQSSKSYQTQVSDLLEEAHSSRVNNLPKSIKLTQKALSLSESFEDKSLYIKGLNQLALYRMIGGEYEEALVLSESVLGICDVENDLRSVADAKYNIASVYYKTNNFYLGLEYLLDCLSKYKKLDDHFNQARCLKSIGTIYEFFGDVENAVKVYDQAIEAGLKAQNTNLVSNVYNPLSGILLNGGEIDKALNMIEESIRLKQLTKDIRGLAFALYGRGKIYIKTKEYDKARADLDESMRMHKEMGDHLGVGMVYNKIAQMFFDQAKYSEAVESLQKALEISEKYDIYLINHKCYDLMSKVYKKLGDFEKALYFLEKYIDAKDSVVHSQTQNVIESYDSISKIEQLEKDAALQKQRTEIIENKNRELDSFFYRVSHDLKGPITSLMGLNNLITSEQVDERLQVYFDMYKKQTHRIHNIVMELIDLTMMERKQDNLKEINFREIIDDCIESYHYLDNFSMINFKVKVKENLKFNSQWSIVNTIIQNLVENSIKYARVDAEPEVSITVNNNSEKVFIKVVDNGIGIDKASQKKIFDMFYRASPIAEGSGLGLYILKRAVERLNGSIELYSVQGEGSEFSIVLPYSTV